ncbi:MAG: CGNR zinc finger domain-containing protein, partial [Micromonosporaceae bacterium]|nr:CGNR zinc finger domain-containing protein [Micromonosporaceae bacterium]
ARADRTGMSRSQASPGAGEVQAIATWQPEAGRGTDRLTLPLLAVAWSAAQLLTTLPPSAVMACPGPGCGWLFHDPRGRRRWCRMQWCGNRAKARRHAARSGGAL